MCCQRLVKVVLQCQNQDALRSALRRPATSQNNAGSKHPDRPRSVFRQKERTTSQVEHWRRTWISFYRRRRSPKNSECKKQKREGSILNGDQGVWTAADGQTVRRRSPGDQITRRRRPVTNLCPSARVFEQARIRPLCTKETSRRQESAWKRQSEASWLPRRAWSSTEPKWKTFPDGITKHLPQGVKDSLTRAAELCEEERKDAAKEAAHPSKEGRVLTSAEVRTRQRGADPDEH